MCRASTSLWPGERLGALPPGAAQGRPGGIPSLPRGCLLSHLRHDFDPLRAGRVIPLRPSTLAPCTPRSRRRPGLQRSAALQPKPKGSRS
ncbi:hypothetical protein KL86PLE_41420 [uncultured Pleomorphomonas sp.]|uniref:Uncharacterized protein n=1 Tax=uncultured Pleomorphomonas sp. TaxID=442121 RepID=A0A212LJ85_9HYPH|nr:hypothetical protein KL86PLE_41420 [uncultured Pleomorphomonas sp.]